MHADQSVPRELRLRTIRDTTKFGETLQCREKVIYPCNHCADGGCEANCAYDKMTTAIAPELFRREVQDAMKRAVIAGVKPDAVSDVLRELAGLRSPGE